MIKACPNCHASILRERTHYEPWIGWLRCEICAYMEKKDGLEKESDGAGREDKQKAFHLYANYKDDKLPS